MREPLFHDREGETMTNVTDDVVDGKEGDLGMGGRKRESVSPAKDSSIDHFYRRRQAQCRADMDKK